MEMFSSYCYSNEKQARPAEELTETFEANGTRNMNIAYGEEMDFIADEWKIKSEKEQQEISVGYRIAYLGNAMVNWCSALGTVFANDGAVDGISGRGDYPVTQKAIRQ